MSLNAPSRSLQKWVATPIDLERQRCRNVDADAQCKRTLTKINTTPFLASIVVVVVQGELVLM